MHSVICTPELDKHRLSPIHLSVLYAQIKVHSFPHKIPVRCDPESQHFPPCYLHVSQEPRHIHQALSTYLLTPCCTLEGKERA
jgi:hypothetical protein